MAITYEFDVAPHMQRARYYRMLREHRWLELHKHDGRGEFWRATALFLMLFWGLVAYGIHAL